MVPYSTWELAGALVCQSILTLVGVAFAAAAFEIVKDPGVPPPPFDAFTRPEQPLIASVAPKRSNRRIFVLD